MLIPNCAVIYGSVTLAGGPDDAAILAALRAHPAVVSVEARPWEQAASLVARDAPEVQDRCCHCCCNIHTGRNTLMHSTT